MQESYLYWWWFGFCCGFGFCFSFGSGFCFGFGDLGLGALALGGPGGVGHACGLGSSMTSAIGLVFDL